MAQVIWNMASFWRYIIVDAIGKHSSWKIVIDAKLLKIHHNPYPYYCVHHSLKQNKDDEDNSIEEYDNYTL